MIILAWVTCLGGMLWFLVEHKPGDSSFSDPTAAMYLAVLFAFKTYPELDFSGWG